MLPNTTLKQRERFYGDVEELLDHGFLSHSLRIGRTQITLRTLCPRDLYLLRYRSDLQDEEWRRWAIAHAVWMVDGYSVLEERNAAVRVFKSLSAIPIRAVDLLFSIFAGLVSRQNNAVDAVESYMYEKDSRTKWKSYHGNPENLLSASYKLGLNTVQRIWILYNRAEDDMEDWYLHWEGFKLVASSNSPKGVQKIDQKDAQRKREEQERRKSVQDRYYYYRMGVVDREGFVQDRNRDLVGSKIGGPKSVEQLEDEMKRWVSGDNDEHDNIVEAYKQRILDRQDQIEREREERRRRLAEEAALRDQQGFEPTPMVGYTQEQMAQILAQRGQGRPSGARFVYDDSFQQTKNRLDRHVQKAGSGNLKVRGGRVVDPQANPQTDQRTLQELIQGRNVQYNDEAPQDLREDSEKIDPSVFGGQTRRRD